MNLCDTRTVQIPACDEHEGFHSIKVKLYWVCPVCDGPRGKVFRTISYDGSRQLGVDGWNNPCGHVDKYSAVRREAEETLEREMAAVTMQVWAALRADGWETR